MFSEKPNQNCAVIRFQLFDACRLREIIIPLKYRNTVFDGSEINVAVTNSYS